MAVTLKGVLMAGAMSLQPCSVVPEFGAFSQKYEFLVDAHVQANWEPRYHPFKCAAMAQLIAESSGNERAVSRTGAKGLAQFMDATWADVSRRYGFRCSPFDPKCAINAYTLFSMQLIRYFKAPRPDGDRVGGWMVTAYHAGAGNADKAQVRCQGATLYATMEPCLPAVIGEQNAELNRRYVRRIASLYRRMTGRELLSLTAPKAPAAPPQPTDSPPECR